MEYISKDDAKILIDLIKGNVYSIDVAKKYISICDRLKMYIDDPDSERVKKEKIKN